LKSITSAKQIIFLALLLLCISGCKSLNDTGAGRFYHNLTSRFNGYFNAKEKMRVTELRIFDEYVDNYSNILPIFPTTVEATAKTYLGDMEIISRKCAKVTAKHPNSKWIDDCYFLVAKTYFYKRDYFSAIESFSYIADKYFKEYSGQQSILWIARSYVELNKLDEAQIQLNTIQEKKSKLSERDWSTFKLIKAQYLIARADAKDHKEAIKLITEALPYHKTRREKNRLHFIIAQIQQRLGQDKNAVKNFRYVIKHNPPYELAFQAKLGLAETDDNVKEVRKYLIKMTKDEKNKTYFDKIYYALGKNEEKFKNYPAAIKFYKLSIQYGNDNRVQKTLGYKTLGDLYFNQTNYPAAKAYYDSTSKFIDKSFPNADLFRLQQEVLSELIKNLLLVKQNDSLIRISLLDTAEQNKFIRNLAKKELDEAKRIQEAKNKNEEYSSANQNQFIAPNLEADASNGMKYFYNPSALKQGQIIFRNKWGDRDNVDNWRTERAAKVKKEVIDSAGNPNRSAQNNRQVLPTSLEKYYEYLPKNNSQRNLMLREVDNALYTMGNIYFTRLKDFDKASESFKSSLARFPDGGNAAASAYNLYLINLQKGDSTQAKFYKQLVLANYAGSTYADLILNPNKTVSLNIKDNGKISELEELYAEAYQASIAKDCKKIEALESEANQKFKNNYLRPKLKYLKYLCLYKNDNSYKIIDSLRSFSENYPTDPLAAQAVQLIDYLNKLPKKDSSLTKKPENNQPQNPDDQLTQKLDNRKDSAVKYDQVNKPKELPKQPAVITYVDNPDDAYYFVLIVSSSVNSAIPRTELSNYNNENLAEMNLQVSGSLLDEKNQLIYVTGFANEKEAFAYHQTLSKRPGFYENMSLGEYRDVIISVKNFSSFYKNKDVDGYTQYFRTKFLK